MRHAKFWAGVGAVSSLIGIASFLSGHDNLGDFIRRGKVQEPQMHPPVVPPASVSQVVEQRQVQSQPQVPRRPPSTPTGTISIKKQVAVFGSRFYGWKTPLLLDSVENIPGERLRLRFIIENEARADYSFRLSEPKETAVAMDEERNVYEFIESEEITTGELLAVPAGGRRSFAISFKPLESSRRTLLVRLSFEQVRDLSQGFSVSGQSGSSVARVEIPSIPLYRFNS